MKKAFLTIIPVAALALTACGSGSDSAGASNAARGPIKIWYSNNAQEVAWGKSMVAAWNAAHPDEKVTAQEIPAGKSSEEVIGAAIAAGNAPCLVLNTAPAAVPGFQKQGGLVALDEFPGAKEYLQARVGDRLAQYASPDGKYYQVPWKSNPVSIIYNKDIFKKAGLDPENPKLASYADFLETSRKLVSAGGAKAAIWPAPTSEFYQSWFDYYPLLAAQTGKQLVEDGKAQFASPEGQKAAQMWKTMYAEKLAPKESFNGDAFGEGKAAMATVGPWAISVYGDKIKWGVAPVPTADGSPAKGTFSDQKSIGMYSSCQNKATAWDVIKFATSKEQDGKLLEATGQMPMRQDLLGAFPQYFAKNKDYEFFAEQAEHTIEAPNVANSVEIWQTFRDAYTKAVIFGKGDLNSTFEEAADKVEQLAEGQ
ncbi:ABC transporter substrate-binding protein [Streptomyces chromofuscus]|uniref:ABC transporter substrate-binding protein n=1 Tax=Streptomyces chromofuscus TaxID=42881 RepID=UPI00167698D6|nr:extracellular solute-binding protein [Streptomyces chromofuscus]GGT43882.1 sugar ABC transporter substrate-binding protein [Streptomyces chromofuscus]